MIWHRFPLHVRYADTDQMGVIHNAMIPIYFEQGRLDICHKAGIPYEKFEEEGYFMMVAELGMRLKKPIRYGETLFIDLAIGKLKGRFLEFEYRIEGEPLGLRVTGFSKHLVTDQNYQPASMPLEFLGKFQSIT